jgi:L-threonylcarbamoyladenylate synthase
MSPWATNRRVREIARGAVFGYPTDTIWGFGCHPLLAGSVARILNIKNRSPEKGLILLASRLEFCQPYLDAPAADLAPLRVAGDHPVTWLVPASPACPPWISGRHDTVAVRITDHPLVALLCGGISAPIVSTSANRGGRPSARNALQMRRQFGDELDFIVTGFRAGGDRPSEIKSLADGSILRSRN